MNQKTLERLEYLRQHAGEPGEPDASKGCKSGVRREARCDIPAGGRRNGRRNSWVISLPRGENRRGQEQTEQAVPTRKRCKVGHPYDPLAKGSSGNNMTIWMQVTGINKPHVPYHLVNLFTEEP